MVTDAAQRGERRRMRTRAKLIDAAEELLANGPFAAVRIEDIADGADMSVGAVYVHFENKDGVIAAVGERIATRAIDQLTAALEPGQSPYEQFAAAGPAYMRFLLDNPAFLRYLATESAGPESQALQESASRTISALLSLFESAIQACVDAGEIRTLDARLMAHFLFGAWNGVAGLVLGPTGATLTAADVEQCLEQARQIVLAGLASTPARTEGQR
ncbi:hypothetical protein ASG69_11080 [Rhodococcus sp. Leaf225]|nr:hypothetical protein ASG69_11080 [Rhodococcus sp. Leaf225]KQU47552.1 hypothetical protein ASH03_21900 [Rhodococcus sp. Leaf258]